jgi:hypothetical protein
LGLGHSCPNGRVAGNLYSQKRTHEAPRHQAHCGTLWSVVLSTAVLGILTVVTGAIYLLPVPRTGLLAVLWWAGILAFFILAGLYTIRAGLIAKRGGRASRDSSPSQLMLWVVFLTVVALVAVVLLALHVLPGT